MSDERPTESNPIPVEIRPQPPEETEPAPPPEPFKLTFEQVKGVRVSVEDLTELALELKASREKIAAYESDLQATRDMVFEVCAAICEEVARPYKDGMAVTLDSEDAEEISEMNGELAGIATRCALRIREASQKKPAGES